MVTRKGESVTIRACRPRFAKATPGKSGGIACPYRTVRSGGVDLPAGRRARLKNSSHKTLLDKMVL